MLIPTEEAWKGLESTAVLQNVNLKGALPSVLLAVSSQREEQRVLPVLGGIRSQEIAHGLRFQQAGASRSSPKADPLQAFGVNGHTEQP